jgi:putative hemin transport protein
MQTETISSPATAIGDPQALYAAFHALRRERKLRHRDAALALGVTECEAVAAAVGQRGPMSSVRLAGPWPELFERMPCLGTVMALTRNECAVHEKIGRYEDMSHDRHVGLALGSAIDLRIFYSRWAHVFAVREDAARGVQRSLQVFDGHGSAIHKVFLRAESDLSAWETLVAECAHQDQSPRVELRRNADADLADGGSEVDVQAFQRGWLALTDTHGFYPLLRRFGLSRTRALVLAPSGYACRVRADAARQLLEDAAASGIAIMCFVGNAGMIQIHSGPVRRVEMMGEWLNVLDPDFNLHLRQDSIASAWVVRKPTADGPVTSLELYDARGDTAAMFFGARKPGIPEQPAWRTLIDALPRCEP